MTLDEIARANNLSAPYTIRIGQTLKVKSETPSKPEVKDTPKVEKDVVKETVKQPVKEPETPKQETKAPEKPKAQKAQTQKTEKPVQKVETKLEPKVQKEVRVPIKDIKVARGDTLYSISREYSVPVNDLAVMNGLSAPFALNVGQTLHVPDLQARKAEATKKSAPTTTKVADKKSEPKQVTPKQNATTKKETKTTKTEPAKKAESVKKTDTKKAETKKVEPKKQDVKKVEKTDSKKTAQNKTAPKATSKTDTPKIAARSSSKFSWPVRGTVLSHYGAKTGGLYNDGINISAALNTAVVAAENGVVAYAGNEVRGMGNLVIIQHADGWMTVYAHMNSMTVRRGARVSVGQKIGTVGKTGKVTSPQLHFEIRKGTKAYNPVNYLKK
jgi:murein DD-endopeptidase MepM/ murein hydrolase activator NlpD